MRAGARPCARRCSARTEVRAVDAIRITRHLAVSTARQPLLAARERRCAGEILTRSVPTAPPLSVSGLRGPEPHGLLRGRACPPRGGTSPVLSELDGSRCVFGNSAAGCAAGPSSRVSLYDRWDFALSWWLWSAMTMTGANWLPGRNEPHRRAEACLRGLLALMRLGCARPMPRALSDPVRIAGQRWTIESNVGHAKGEVGPDRYAAHSDIGWHRPAALAMLAQAYRAAAASNGTASASSMRRDPRIHSFPVRPPRAHASGKGEQDADRLQPRRQNTALTDRATDPLRPMRSRSR